MSCRAFSFTDPLQRSSWSDPVYPDLTENFESRHKCTRLKGVEANEASRLIVAGNVHTRSSIPRAAPASTVMVGSCMRAFHNSQSNGLPTEPASDRHAPKLLSFPYETPATRRGFRDWRGIARFLAPPVYGD